MFPTGSVSGEMVVAAEGNELVGGGRSAFCPRDSMVQVAVNGRHPTTGEDAVTVAAFDIATPCGGGPLAGDAAKIFPFERASIQLFLMESGPAIRGFLGTRRMERL
jgi:hypothetical protein